MACITIAGASGGSSGAGIRAQRVDIHEPSECCKGDSEEWRLPEQALQAYSGAPGSAGYQQVLLLPLLASSL